MCTSTKSGWADFTVQGLARDSQGVLPAVRRIPVPTFEGAQPLLVLEVAPSQRFFDIFGMSDGGRLDVVPRLYGRGVNVGVSV